MTTDHESHNEKSCVNPNPIYMFSNENPWETPGTFSHFADATKCKSVGADYSA